MQRPEVIHEVHILTLLTQEHPFAPCTARQEQRLAASGKKLLCLGSTGSHFIYCQLTPLRAELDLRVEETWMFTGKKTRRQCQGNVSRRRLGSQAKANTWLMDSPVALGTHFL